MKTLVPHNLTRQDIDPKLHEKFSPNLFAFLFNRKGSPFLAYARVYRDDQNTLWIGLVEEEENFFTGCRLMTALQEGRKTQRYSYPLHHFSGLKEVENFWEDYKKVGRCAIDPDHDIYYIDDTRWKVEGNTRSCLWCQNCKQEMEHYEVTEKRTRWVITT